MKKTPLKRKSISKLKKELDAVFSKYIRTKYSKNGMVKCYTCQHIGEIKRMQNGHFNPRQHLATRYDERNCRPQCFACNMYYGGNPATFATNLKKEYGEGIIEELEKTRWEIFKADESWYLKKIEYYKNELAKLEE